MVLAHFPSSKHFFDAWSDPELVRDAYPLRQAMLQGGFQHVWLRCEQAESSEFQRLAWIRRPDAHRPSASDELDGDDYFKLALAAFILGIAGFQVYTGVSEKGYYNFVADNVTYCTSLVDDTVSRCNAFVSGKRRDH